MMVNARVPFSLLHCLLLRAHCSAYSFYMIISFRVQCTASTSAAGSLFYTQCRKKEGTRTHSQTCIKLQANIRARSRLAQDINYSIILFQIYLGPLLSKSQFFLLLKGQKHFNKMAIIGQNLFFIHHPKNRTKLN